MLWHPNRGPHVVIRAIEILALTERTTSFASMDPDAISSLDPKGNDLVQSVT